MSLSPQIRRSLMILGALTVLTPSVAQAAPAPSPTPTPTLQTTAGTVPVFNASDCPSDLVPTEMQGEVEARCGWVQVPQRHGRPGLRPLMLPVDVFTTANLDRTSTPLVYLSGGPGGPGIDEATRLFMRSPLGQVVLRDRPLIAFDQRGTVSASPALRCPAFERDSRNYDPSTPLQTLVDGARSCHDTLQSQGLDSAAFNTTETAADMDDIRRALGYEQVDVLGVHTARLPR